MKKIIITVMMVLGMMTPAFAFWAPPTVPLSDSDDGPTTCYKMYMNSEVLNFVIGTWWPPNSTEAWDAIQAGGKSGKCQDAKQLPEIAARMYAFTARVEHIKGLPWRTDANEAEQDYQKCITDNYGERRSAECETEQHDLIHDTTIWDENDGT